MADEQTPSIDGARIANDIQKVYEQFQAQVADALRDEQAALTVALKTFQERWLREVETVQREIGTVAKERAASIKKDFAVARSRLLQTLRRADHIGHLGWTVTTTMTLPDFAKLLGMKSKSEADAHMLTWYEADDPDLNDLEKRFLEVKALKLFHTPISQCFSAYRRGDYAITIPCLVAVFERGMRNFVATDPAPTKHFFSPNVKKMADDRYDKEKKDDPERVNVYVGLSLCYFVQWFYESYGLSNYYEDRPFRHGIQHGTQPPPNEKIEVLRLFHALDAVATLYPD